MGYLVSALVTFALGLIAYLFAAGFLAWIVYVVGIILAIIFEILVPFNYLAIACYIIFELQGLFKNSKKLIYFSRVCLSIYIINYLIIMFFLDGDFLGTLLDSLAYINLDTVLIEILEISRPII